MKLAFVLVALTCSVNLCYAQDRNVDYLRDVKPILRERCYSCHAAIKQEAGLRLDTGALAVQGGESGAAVVPKDAVASLLFHRVSSDDPGLRMPPEGNALTAQQIQVLARWIELGGNSPAEEAPEKDPGLHWAFQRPVRPSLAAPNSSSAALGFNPIDTLLQAKRMDQGVVPLPPTDKGTLLRRVYLDLIGLPPSANDLQAFLDDTSENAYEAVVDRLLASPQHGERWGRHWMDVWRYSDWYGRRSVPDVMNSYPMVWRWRDWIVNSINESKPYDQMVTEMLAADEIFPDSDRNTAATGYLVRSWFKWNYETWKKDLVEHTGKAFLGLTLNCCQCHDHKYDPLKQEEYFRFRAFFEPLELRHDRVPGDADPGPFQKYVYAKSYGPIQSGMVRVFDEYLDAETFMFSNGDARLRIEGKPPVTPAPPSLLSDASFPVSRIVLPITAAYPGMKEFIRDEERTKRRIAMKTAETEWNKLRSASTEALPNYELQLRAAETRLKAAELECSSLELRMQADSARYASGLLSEDKMAEPQVAALIRSAARAEREAAAATANANWVASEAAIATAELKIEEATQSSDKPGTEQAKKSLTAAQKASEAAKKALDAANAKAADEPGEYTPLSPKYPQVTSGRRTALANWIVRKENPLAARVAVNHIWLRHFGQAIVETTHDFGRNGSPPTHPELLDWLACEFMDSGWSMKHMHRLMVTSQLYRSTSMLPRSLETGSNDRALAEQKDPENKLYWRFPTMRMQAEVVRDSLLAVAGELDHSMGGHEIDHKQGMKSRRRSLYFSHHGEEKMEFLELFDAANACDCYKRSSSVQPQQALALTNSELTKTLSRTLAKRIWDDRPKSNEGSSDDFIRAAFFDILNREPREQELNACSIFLEQQADRLKPPDGSDSKMDTAMRARENLIHALMNHNDFVTVR
jgi:hypothetical protein